MKNLVGLDELLLKLAGGDSVSDINLLEGDEGLCRVMGKAEWQDQVVNCGPHISLTVSNNIGTVPPYYGNWLSMSTTMILGQQKEG